MTGAAVPCSIPVLGVTTVVVKIASVNVVIGSRRTRGSRCDDLGGGMTWRTSAVGLLASAKRLHGAAPNLPNGDKPPLLRSSRHDAATLLAGRGPDLHSPSWSPFGVGPEGMDTALAEGHWHVLRISPSTRHSPGLKHEAATPLVLISRQELEALRDVLGSVRAPRRRPHLTRKCRREARAFRRREERRPADALSKQLQSGLGNGVLYTAAGCIPAWSTRAVGTSSFLASTTLSEVPAPGPRPWRGEAPEENPLGGSRGASGRADRTRAREWNLALPAPGREAARTRASPGR